MKKKKSKQELELERRLERALGYVPEPQHVDESVKACKGMTVEEIDEELGRIKKEADPVEGYGITQIERSDELKIARVMKESEPELEPLPKVPKMRGQKCWDPSHKEEILELKNSLMRVREELANERQAREEALAKMVGMIDKSLAEEAERTAYMKGRHEAQEEERKKREAEVAAVKATLEGVNRSEIAEADKAGYERGIIQGAIDQEALLKKQSACFKVGHGQWEGMIPVRLSMPEIISLFEQLRKAAFVSGGLTVPVLLKDGLKPSVDPNVKAMEKLIDENIARVEGRKLK